MIGVINISYSASPRDTKLTVMDNGLKIITQEDHSVDLVGLLMYIKVGSLYETPEVSGITHFCEHMIFDGTPSRDYIQVKKEIKNLGGYINGATTQDYTHFDVIVPSEYLDEGLDVQSDIILNSTFDKELLDMERNVVVEEILKALNDPERIVKFNLYKEAFKEHPYQRSVLGSSEVIETVPAEVVWKWHRDYYTPGNMILIVVGDFNTEEIIEKIKNIYGKIENSEIPELNISEEPEQKDIRRIVVEKNVKKAYLSIGYHVPKDPLSDGFELKLLEFILNEGKSSRLEQNIKNKKLVTDISATYSILTGMFIIEATLKPDKLEEAEGAIINEFNKLKEEPLTEEELNKAKTLFKSNYALENEVLRDRGKNIGYWTILGGLDLYLTYSNKILEVTPEKIQEVTSKYFKNNYTISIIKPEEKKEETSLINYIKSSREKSNNTLEHSSENVKKIILNNGITVITRENEFSELSAIQIFVKGGQKTEKKAGLANLVCSLLTKGTNSKNADELALDIDKLGAIINTAAYEDYCNINLVSLDERFEPSLDILKDIILTPSFPENELKNQIEDNIVKVKSKSDETRDYAEILANSNLFPAHPYGNYILGNEMSLKEISQKDLIEYYNESFIPGNMVISISGPRKNSEFIEIVENTFGKINETQTEEYTNQDLPELKKDKLETNFNKKQSAVILAFRAPAINSEDYLSFEVMNSIFGKDSSARLTLELREKQGLAYTVRSYYTPFTDSGKLIIYIGTSPEKIETSIKEIQKQINLICTEEVDEKELQGGINRYTGSFLMDHQILGNQTWYTGYFELMGLGYEFDEEIHGKIKDITSSQVIKVAQKYLNTDNYSLIIVK